MVMDSLPPVAVDDTFSTNRNTLVSFNPTRNDTLNGQLFALNILNAPKNGALSFAGIDSLIYFPNNTFCGKDTFQYIISNQFRLCDTATIIVSVDCQGNVNTMRPDAGDDFAFAQKNKITLIPVLANDVSNGALTDPLSILRQPAKGTATVSGFDIIYTPLNNVCGGNDTLTYIITNAIGSDTAQVVIFVDCNVTNNNANKPVAVNDFVSTRRNSAMLFKPTLNDTLNGTLNGLSIVVAPTHGSVAFRTIDSLVFLPQFGYCGNDTLSYRVCNQLFLCDTAQVVFTISCDLDTTGGNMFPVALDDAENTTKNTAVTISVLSNDNPNGMMTRPLSIVTQPTNGTATISVNDIVYKPKLDFCGQNDTFTYEICNTRGCDTAQVVVSVSCNVVVSGGGLPKALNDFVTTNRNVSITFNPTSNDTLNGNLLGIGVQIAPMHGSISFIGKDSIKYSPDNNFCGKDTIKYSLNRDDFKSDSAFIFINVVCTATGERPDAINDFVSTKKNSSVVISILSNDALNGTLTKPLSIIDQPKNGTVIIQANNDVLYTPNSNFCGSNDTFTYEICNNIGCDIAQVVVTVNCVTLLKPDARNDVATTSKNQQVPIDVLANDNLNGILEFIEVITQPKNGAVSVFNDQLIYAPFRGFCGGNDTLTYRISNSNGFDTAQVIITVSCDAAPKPKAVLDNESTLQGQNLTILALKNDTLFGQNLDSINVISKPKHGKAKVNASNSIVYSPDISFCGDNDTLTYAIFTVGGSDTNQIIIAVTCDPNVTKLPVALFDTASVEKGELVMVDVIENDSMRGADTFRITKNPKYGNASFDANNALAYQSDGVFCGGVDTLIYEICNRNGCDTAVVYVKIICDLAAGLSPIAENDKATTLINVPVGVSIFQNDSTRGGKIDSLKQPRNGTVALNGNTQIYYVPKFDFWGRDTFSYTICNANGCSTAQVYVYVNPGDSLVVYSGFSPNNDRVNDRLILRGIENYPNNEVIVYNRWGNEVFRRKGYTNDEGWEGNWKGFNVPDGTYFYLIQLNDEKKQVKTGYLQILR